MSGNSVTKHEKSRPIHNFLYWLIVILGLIAVCTIIGCSKKEQKAMTLNELEKQSFKVTVEGVDFDVPVLYHYNEYEYFKNWPQPTEDELEGKRKVVDVLKFQALLPDLLPYSEQTAKGYELPGHQNILRVYMKKKSVSWEYYFSGAFKRLEPMPPSSVVKGMYQFRDPLSNNDLIYLSDLAPAIGLKRLDCDDPKHDPEPSVYPACTLTTSYMQDKFQLELTFRLEHLSQWESIEEKTIKLLDQFKH